MLAFVIAMRRRSSTHLLLSGIVASACFSLAGCTGLISGGGLDLEPGGPDSGVKDPPADQAALTGIVNNPVTGQPVVGATIFIDDAELGLTDAEGRFHITGLPAGTVSLRATAGEGPCVVPSVQSTATLALGALASEDLELVNPGAIVKKTLVVNFDPLVPGGQRLHEARGWTDPRSLTESYVEDLLYCSGNRVFYDVVEWQDVDGIPRKADGYQYTTQGFLNVLDGNAQGHQPDSVDYLKLISDYDLAARVDAGEIDEVLMWGAPYFGFWESQMVGPDAYWVNSGPIEYASTKKFIIMGLNYERGVAEALHSYGHRSESIMSHVYGGWDSANPSTEWDRFAAYDGQHVGSAGCGNIHWPPNATSDYDYGNSRQVSSICDSFNGGASSPQSVSRSTWDYQGDFSRGYLRWWYAHIPVADGSAGGKEKNWWKYLADFNGYAASR